MAAYNPRNFDLSQFMNDLFQQPDLGAQLQFLGNHLHVINSYAAGMEQELLQTHINFPRFLPIFPDFLERLSHLAPIY
jgi:hypothetical protein